MERQEQDTKIESLESNLTNLYALVGPIVDQAKSFSQDFMSAEEPSSLPDD